MSRSELRYDPLTRRWAIIAAKRAERPVEPEDRGGSSPCPFCEGNEGWTPPEVFSVRDAASAPDGPGWRVRVIPNKYPALSPGEAGEFPVDFHREPGPEARPRPARGVQEVVIETPQHAPAGPPPADELELLLPVYRDRLRALLADGRYRHGFFFKNSGRAAGASLSHPHSQVVTLADHPPAVLEEVAACRAYRERAGSTLLGDEIERELVSGLRIVAENDAFVAYCPAASRFPFEMRLVPRAARSDFRDLADGGVPAAAGLLADVLLALARALDAPAYNYLLRSVPEEPAFRWHIDVLPRITGVAGFEWTSGIHINPVPPEEAAARLRDCAGVRRGELPA